MNSTQEEKPSLSALRIDPKARAFSKTRKPWLWIGGAALTVAILIFFWISGPDPVDVQSIPVSSAPVPTPAYPGQDQPILSASGYVTPRRKATVAAKITGSIREMWVEEGMKVKKGQILAKLDDRDAQAASRSARAERDVVKANIPELQIHLKEASLNLERAKTLFQEGILSKENLDKAQASFGSLEAKLSLAQKQVEAAQARTKIALREIENCIIRAPFSGIAVSKDAQVGEIVSPLSAGGGFTRTGISTIVDMSSLEIEVDVSESYIARINLGQKVTATLDAYPEWQIPARVRAIIPTADRQKATVKVRIAFGKLDPKILPDMGIKVSFLAEKEKEQESHFEPTK